jgi:SAM-dependent methyltransferase
VDEANRDRLERLRSRVASRELDPAAFRRALLDVPWLERDAWLDRLLELGPPPDDGPELPRGCVPYLPCAVDGVLSAVELAGVMPSDVVVDVGAGVGRTAALVQLLTGASVVGIEIQPQLARAARQLQQRLNLPRFSVVEGDAAELVASLGATVFFLYCPFGQDRLQALLDRLEPAAQARELRICAVDLPVPPRPWLLSLSPPGHECAVLRSTAAPYALANGESGRA